MVTHQQTKHIVHKQYCILSLFFLKKIIMKNGVVSMKKEGGKKGEMGKW
jgi:hypothetical protein